MDFRQVNSPQTASYGTSGRTRIFRARADISALSCAIQPRFPIYMSLPQSESRREERSNSSDVSGMGRKSATPPRFQNRNHGRSSKRSTEAKRAHSWALEDSIPVTGLAFSTGTALRTSARAHFQMGLKGSWSFPLRRSRASRLPRLGPDESERQGAHTRATEPSSSR